VNSFVWITRHKCTQIITFLGVVLVMAAFTRVKAQGCPPNIDFENGDFSGWTCYIGNTQAIGNQNQISLAPSPPIPGRHTLYSSAFPESDVYGNFPVNCPNGSGYSVKLGNDQGGGEAEGISYTFTIPANQNSYSLIYHYAVVFQSPGHRPNEQPRMEIEVMNVTDNQVINCASFTFVSQGSSLPGFQVSPITVDTTTILYKPWSAVSVDLSGNAGKTIRMTFKTGDCTFRRHFGYAYIDVNSECSGSFVGATYCRDDTTISVTAPYGYQGYTWYDSSLTNVLGTSQTLTLRPPPRAGTTIAVKLDPYNGYGCPQTMFAQLIDTLTIQANAGHDNMSCNGSVVPIGSLPKQGVIYSWSPAAGLSNPNIANPMAGPMIDTRYVVTARSLGGGCISTDTVLVTASVIDSSLQVIGKLSYCITTGDSSILKVNPTDSIQWFKDNNPITGATSTTYRARQSGVYYALLFNSKGCSIRSRQVTVFIDQPALATRYNVKYAIINIPLQLKARPIGENIVWTPPTSLDNRNSYTPLFTGSRDVLYTIALTTNTGCVTVDTQLVKTIEGVEIYVPTAFTPNNDGRNDVLRPIAKGIKDIVFFRIYNRWGQLLFDTKDEQQGWDGKFKSLPQQTQTIVWMFEGIGVDDKIYFQKGTTVLMR
jgi:gliding motility-associated-like protein